MKRVRQTIQILASSALFVSLMSSCIVTRTVPVATTQTTYVPTPSYSTTYVPTTQVVTQVATHPATQNITVSATSTDISYNLDLQAVGNIFGASSSLEDFERRLNAYDAQISNLDLNRDGYVDYLRVIEVQEGYTHVVVLQAVLGQNIYQDVATIEVERYGSSNTVTIIGDPYIYGTSYVLRPTYTYTPVIYNFFYGPTYRTWRSPYYWGYYPSYYRHRTCVHVHVYRQHIVKCNKHYHHSYHYIDDYRSRYDGIRNSVSRNDYATAHPEGSFSRRNSEVRNARGIQTENTRRTAVKASDSVRKEVTSSPRRTTESATPKVNTTISEASTSRRTSTTSSSSSTGSKATTGNTTSRRTSTTSSSTSSAPKVSTTTSSTSSSRRTSTTTSTPSTSSKATTSSSSSSRRTSTTSSSTSSAPKVSTTTSSTSSSRRTSTTTSTPSTSSKATTSSSSTSRRTSTASSSTSSTPKVSTSSTTRRSSASSSRSSGGSTRSSSSSTSTRSSGSRR